MGNQQDAHDYSNVLAWNLEQAIFDKFKPDENGQNASSEYREKVCQSRCQCNFFFAYKLHTNAYDILMLVVPGAISEIQSAGNKYFLCYLLCSPKSIHDSFLCWLYFFTLRT
jgi:hypothetical protein